MTDLGTPEGRRVGNVVRHYRERSGLTQVEASTASGLAPGYVSGVENGRVRVIYPEAFNPLRKVLNFPGFEMLEAMGYVTDCTEEGISAPLSAVLRGMDADEQTAMLDIAHALTKMRQRKG